MALSANDIGAARALYGLPLGAASTTTSSAPAAAVPALRLTLDPAAASTPNATFSTTGTVSGGAGSYSVQWQTDHGYSGKAVFGNASSWTASGIALVSGVNHITLSAFDAADQSSSQTLTVNYAPAAATTLTTSSAPSGGPITVAISAPAATVVTTSASTLNLAGTATGGAGIVKVTWQTSNGCTGVASGTAHWSISGVAVLTGTNTIIVRAYDASGANAWAAVVAVRN